MEIRATTLKGVVSIILLLILILLSQFWKIANFAFGFTNIVCVNWIYCRAKTFKIRRLVKLKVAIQQHFY